MQKLSAGKFHFEPPFTSFDHLVGAGDQRRDRAALCPRNASARCLHSLFGGLPSEIRRPCHTSTAGVEPTITQVEHHRKRRSEIIPFVLRAGEVIE
jgi:hypothetical protein